MYKQYINSVVNYFDKHYLSGTILIEDGDIL